MATLGEYLPNSNTTLYYKLNNNLNDSSGNGKTLTNSNSVTLGETNGKFGGGADFGNTNTNKSLYVQNPGISMATNYTFSCWFKINTEISSGEYQFCGFSKWSSGDGNVGTIMMAYNYNSGNRRVLVYFYDLSKQGLVTKEITLGTTNWYNLLLTTTGKGGNIKGYFNGEYIGEDSVGNNSYSESGKTPNFKIGAFLDQKLNISSPASAIVDEVFLENTIWSNTKIKKYYTNAKGRFGII